MFTTVTVVTAFVSLFCLVALLWGAFLYLGLRWAKVPNVTVRRLALAILTVSVIQPVLSLLFLLPPVNSPTQGLLLGVAEVAAAVWIACLVIMRVFRISLLRSVQAWLPTLAASVAGVAFSLLVFRPFVYEGFVSPTNAMAPALLGDHWRIECPECGLVGVCSPRDARYRPAAPPWMICENFHVSRAFEPGRHVFPADRFLVAKFLAPQRWDIIVFQNPSDPSTLYAMRLVGMPGETIHIEDGAVWADGERLEPPASMRGIEYSADLPDWRRELWASKANPASLGEDEYFVLGDFSLQSFDSRVWERDAPGHSPFAVPTSYVRGVVTHIYWPPQRLRVLR